MSILHNRSLDQPRTHIPVELYDQQKPLGWLEFSAGPPLNGSKSRVLSGVDKVTIHQIVDLFCNQGTWSSDRSCQND